MTARRPIGGSYTRRIVSTTRVLPPAVAGLRSEVYETMDDARDDWRALAAESGNVFGTWEWAVVWLRHFGGDGRLRVVVWRTKAGEPRVLVPLHMTRRGPLRLVRFVGHGPGDELGPVCAPEQREPAARALRATLDALGRRWHVFLGERLPASPAWQALTGATHVRSEASPTLSLAGRSWEDFLAARSANFRQQVGRRERRLGRSHALHYRLSTPESLAADLDLLVRLHDERWGEAGSGAFAGARRRFHDEWAALALAQGWLRLWVLELDGVPAAAWYGFRFAQRESYYQSGRDPAREADSVGFVLQAHTIREATRDGMLEYRFLRGGEAYKDRFADGDAPLDTVLAARTGLARLACRLAVGAQARAPRARRLLSRVAGGA
jgi:CelD/BcsL family acetyltransferase involved in cellulose biosynthesis